jgi:hypothetical protein
MQGQKKGVRGQKPRPPFFLVEIEEAHPFCGSKRLPRVPATPNKKASSGELACLSDSTGAAGRNRTGDLRITNALLYQLSYSGEKERAC